jgi:8-oxo-dGTP diphosphatase
MGLEQTIVILHEEQPSGKPKGENIMSALYSHCHKCGTEYQSQDWPRVCVNDECRFMVWRPIHPVAVLIQPVLNGATGQTGVILGRRGINPHKGVFALPGGFVEFGERAEHAVGRELREEMLIDSRGAPRFSHSYTDDEGHFLLFFVERPLSLAAVEKMYHSTSECTEMKIAYEPEQLAFQSHTLALKRYFIENELRDLTASQTQN